MGSKQDPVALDVPQLDGLRAPCASVALGSRIGGLAGHGTGAVNALPGPYRGPLGPYSGFQRKGYPFLSYGMAAEVGLLAFHF